MSPQGPPQHPDGPPGRQPALAGPPGLPGGGRGGVQPVHHAPRHHRHGGPLEEGQPLGVPLQVRQELHHLHHRLGRSSFGDLHQFSGDLQEV